MQWEFLTAPAFASAVRETATCILPLGVLERHSDHLPLGTDFLHAHFVASRAAEIEPAVVFPPFYFGQIYEARAFPGAFTIAPKLLLELLLSVLDEIGRNGFKKIILYNGHGGNHYLLGFLAQTALWQEKPYQIYLAYDLVDRSQVDAVLDSKFGGHADEEETSQILYEFPGVVDMSKVPANPGEPQDRLGGLKAFNGLAWYANYPEHYAGDARPATAEKGQKLVEIQVQGLARFIADVKSDEVLPALSHEYFERERRIREV